TGTHHPTGRPGGVGGLAGGGLMDLQPVVSSNLDAVGYEAGTHTLRVRFKNGGVYDYQSVPEPVFTALAEAPSPGTYLATAIKPHFKTVKVVIQEEKKMAEHAPVIRCKVYCGGIFPAIKDGAKYAESVSLFAVYGQDGSANAAWSAASPSAQFNLFISNPEAFGR